MLKKLSRLDILEIILVLLGIIMFAKATDYYVDFNNEGLICSACLISIVWIEIHRAKSKKE
jgi:hypothetical protein